MATFDTGQPSFSLQLAKVAVNNLDGTLGAPVTVPSIKVIGFDLKTISDQGQGDSRITALAAQAISCDISIEMTGVTFDVLEVLTGVQATSSHSDEALENYMSVGNIRFPYWSIVSEALAAEGAGDTVFFAPKLKIMSGFGWRFEFGKIVVPQFKAMAILDDYFGEIFQLVERATVAAVVMPPT